MKRAGEPQKKAEDEAINVLMALNEKQPDLRSIIFGQLVERIGNSRPVADMDPLMLQAMLQKGQEEAEADKPIAKVLARSIEAGRELLKRHKAGDKKANPQLVESARC